MNAYDLVIFDFDGTLADSATWFKTKVNQVARKYRFRQITDAEYESLRGCSTAEIISYLGVSPWKFPFIARHMRRLAAREIDQINLFEGVEDLLTKLTEAGVTIAMVTSNNKRNVRRILGDRNANLFVRFATGASLHGKAAKIKSVLKALDADPARTLAIGDEERDIEGARKAGIDAGSVLWGYATREVLEAGKPDYLFASMDEIFATVTGSKNS